MITDGRFTTLHREVNGQNCCVKKTDVCRLVFQTLGRTCLSEHHSVDQYKMDLLNFFTNTSKIDCNTFLFCWSRLEAEWMGFNGLYRAPGDFCLLINLSAWVFVILKHCYDRRLYCRWPDTCCTNCSICCTFVKRLVHYT